MATQIQFRRGTTAEHSTFTGVVGEVTVDTDKDTAVVHDGSTAGGIPLAKESAIPDVSGKADLTGATFTGTVTFDNATVSEVTAITSSTNAATLDLSVGDNFTHTLTENVTYTFSNPAASGKASAFTLKVVQDSTDRTITWPASVDWAAGVAPTISSGSGAVDYFVFITTDSGTTYYGFTAGQALA